MPAQNDDFFLPDLCTVRMLFVLVLVSEILVLVLVLAPSSLTRFSWLDFGLTSLFVQWVMLTSAGLLCRLRPYLSQLSLQNSIAASYGVIVVNIGLFSLFAQWLYLSPSRPNIDFGSLASNLLTGAILAGLTLRYFYVQQRLLAKEQAELQARVQALQARIRPHFLFNSMNTIAELISVDPEQAERVVEDMSVLFRASLSDSGAQIPLREELDLCRKYLRIEALRLGDRLQVQWLHEQLPDGLKIPMLTLQPVLENAIYHGIQPLPEGGTINVEIVFDGHKLTIKVVNPKPKNNVTHGKGNHMALKNIHSRLLAIYGDSADLSTHDRETFYETSLSYPYPITSL